jgi:hypothetical protein
MNSNQTKPLLNKEYIVVHEPEVNNYFCMRLIISVITLFILIITTIIVIKHV